MHILFIVDNFPPEVTAAANRVYERAVYWVKWGHKVTIITSAPNFPQGRVYPGYKNSWYKVEIIDGMRVVRVKTFVAPNEGFYLRVLDFLSFMMTSFVAGFFQKRPDIIVATSPQFFSAVSGWALSFFRRKKFIFELSDLWPDSIVAVGAMKKSLLIELIEKIELFLYRQSSAIIALSHSIRNNLVKRKINEKKIHVVINGVDTTTLFPREKDKSLMEEFQLNGKFVLGYIGTQGMAYDLTNVVEAAKNLEKENPNIVFLFVGDGAEHQKLVELVKAYQLKNVIFIPQQTKKEIGRYWSLCDMGLIHLKNSNVFETVLPSKLFDAIGMGLPILLVAPYGEAARLIEEKEIGMHVSPANPQLLSTVIEKIQSEQDKLAIMSSNSKKWAAFYSRENQAKHFLDIMEQLLIFPEKPVDIKGENISGDQ